MEIFKRFCYVSYYNYLWHEYLMLWNIYCEIWRHDTWAGKWIVTWWLIGLSIHLIIIDPIDYYQSNWLLSIQSIIIDPINYYRSNQLISIQLSHINTFQWRPANHWHRQLHLLLQPEGPWQGRFHEDSQRRQWGGRPNVRHLGEGSDVGQDGPVPIRGRHVN